MKVIYYYTTCKCLYNILWRALIQKVLWWWQHMTPAHQNRGNHSTKIFVLCLLWPKLLEDLQWLHTWVSFGQLSLQWPEVCHPPPISGCQRMDPMLVVSGHAFCSLSKECISGNSALTISVGYVTVGTGYAPTWRIQLNQCHVTYILTAKYVPYQHSLSWQLSVRWGSP